MIVISLFVGVAVYFAGSPAPDVRVGDVRSGCLGEDEVAEYKLEKVQEFIGRATITTHDSKTQGRQFSVQDVMLHTYHPVEVRQCGVYVIREFNYDFKRSEPLPGFRVELWRYEYPGRGERLLDLAGYAPEARGAAVVSYSYDFRIDSQERYLVLARGYLGSPDFAIVIKDLKTLEDVFVFPIAEVAKKNPDIIGDVGFYQGWSKDSRYFWADFFGGAPVFGYVRIDSNTWTYDLFPAPPDVLGGDQLNIETGWLTVHPGNIWFGFAEEDEAEKAKRRAQGIGTDLYIENLLTKERLFVAHTDEPLHYFKPKWLSDTELEYFLPDGERRVYRIPE